MNERFVDRLELLPRGARVLVGLSGGVDSSVAALVLRDRGFDVVGVTLHLWEYGHDDDQPARCCAPSDIDDARQTAAVLGIPFFTFDRRADFAAKVVEPFVEDYLDGRTPSPCVHCNREVKLGAFSALAVRLGAQAVATGHYARTGAVVDEGGVRRSVLRRGTDRRKDQSYFLYGLGSDLLEKMVLPLGDREKDDVRAMARAAGLPNADKPDSEDLCFTGGDHVGFVDRRAHDRIRPGPIVDDSGRVVAQHDGIHRFTVGQRKGLGVSLGRPVFVTEVDSSTGTVRLGEASKLGTLGARLGSVTWIEQPSPEEVITARIRYRHDGEPATVVQLADGGVDVTFQTPARAVTPGQVCVFYRGDQVLGGGVIQGPSPTSV